MPFAIRVAVSGMFSVRLPPASDGRPDVKGGGAEGDCFGVSVCLFCYDIEGIMPLAECRFKRSQFFAQGFAHQLAQIEFPRDSRSLKAIGLGL
jgi:hypothetical protein